MLLGFQLVLFSGMVRLFYLSGCEEVDELGRRHFPRDVATSQSASVTRWLVWLTVCMAASSGVGAK